MMRPSRYAALACVLSASLATTARAVDLPRTTPPPDTVDVEEPHRFAPFTQGIVGAAAGGALVVGVGLLAVSYAKYAVLIAGGDGNSCRPCSSSQVSGMRGEYYSGIAFLGIGGVLAIVTGVLAGLDYRYVKDHTSTRLSRVQLTPTGLRF